MVEIKSARFAMPMQHSKKIGPELKKKPHKGRADDWELSLIGNNDIND